MFRFWKNDGLLETMIYETRVLKSEHVKYHVFNVLIWISGSNWMMFLANWTRQGDQQSHPHWPWDVTLYQNGRHEWNRRNTWKSQTSPVLRRQMDLHLENKGLLKIFPGKGNFSKNHQVLGGCSCNLLYPSGGYGRWLIYADWIITYAAALLCQTFHAKSLTAERENWKTEAS